MRRPHVYERSVPRARRDLEQEGGADYGPSAKATIAAVPALLREAEAAGAVTSRIHRGFHRIGVVLAVPVLLLCVFEAGYELWWVWSTHRAYADYLAKTPSAEAAADAFERMALSPHVADYSMPLFMLALAAFLYVAARAVGWILAGFLRT